MVGDTDSTDEQLQDEEIAYFLTTYTSVGTAAVHAARAIMAKISRQVTKAVGDLRISLSDRWKHYVELVDYLEGLALFDDPYQIYSGGLSIADATTDRADTDLSQPAFEVGMHDLTPTNQHQHQHRGNDNAT